MPALLTVRNLAAHATSRGITAFPLRQQEGGDNADLGSNELDALTPAGRAPLFGVARGPPAGNQVR